MGNSRRLDFVPAKMPRQRIHPLDDAFVASMHIRRRTDAFGVRIFVGGCAQRGIGTAWTNCAEHLEGGSNLMLRLA
jgi:hypothetical protein